MKTLATLTMLTCCSLVLFGCDSIPTRHTEVASSVEPVPDVQDAPTSPAQTTLYSVEACVIDVKPPKIGGGLAALDDFPTKFDDVVVLQCYDDKKDALTCHVLVTGHKDGKAIERKLGDSKGAAKGKTKKADGTGVVQFLVKQDKLWAKFPDDGDFKEYPSIGTYEPGDPVHKASATTVNKSDVRFTFQWRGFTSAFTLVH